MHILDFPSTGPDSVLKFDARILDKLSIYRYGSESNLPLLSFRVLDRVSSPSYM